MNHSPFLTKVYQIFTKNKGILLKSCYSLFIYIRKNGILFSISRNDYTSEV